MHYRPVAAPEETSAGRFENRTIGSADLVPYEDGYHRRLIAEIQGHLSP